METIRNNPKYMGERYTPPEIAKLESERMKTQRKAEAEAGRRRKILEGAHKEKLTRGLAEGTITKDNGGVFSGLKDSVVRENLAIKGMGQEEIARLAPERKNHVQQDYRKARDEITLMNVLHEQAFAENERRDQQQIEEARRKLNQLFEQKAAERNESLLGRVSKKIGKNPHTAIDMAHEEALKENRERKSES